MFDVLRSTLGALRQCVAELDPERLTTDQAAEVLEVFAEVERAAVGGKLLVAARAAEGTTWLRAGHRSAASWLAELSRTGMGEAIGSLETAERLARLPKTAEAVRRGELSAAQAREISAAGIEDPGAEEVLLESAAHDTFKELRDRAAKVRAAAASEAHQAEREARIHRSRFLRSWRDGEGAFRLDAKLSAEDGAQVLATLEHEARRHFEAARESGVHESEAAYLADALVGLCAEGAGTSAGARPPARVHLRVDLAALRRGRLEPGELCEIPGVGPVSLATARGLVGDSFVRLFVTDGVDVHSVVHVGRTIPASVRSAVEERDRSCVVPGCGATRFLEIDHWQVDYAQGGATELWNLARLCPHHHRLKTRGEFELAGGPGKWEFRRRQGSRGDAAHDLVPDVPDVEHVDHPKEQRSLVFDGH